MKNLLFLCGPNGIGKTTISKEIVRQLPNTAYVDSEPQPFTRSQALPRGLAIGSDSWTSQIGGVK
ncbi:hypothetical protein DW1_1468 [Proteiniborus sp. DW1]|nr:hypothetical protein DW1_1468 [Proteiniborus sp. DW1]